ncbi:nuclear receptor binding set domain containing protein 1, nsd, putative [Anopheles sinensis]|uniref:Nuclear receptor binding set domain containing protein 1, nsd, putative n=1 Tax=Anopheles sinensis TaxID=74873 RepID=A0A084W935_ANOSI|nr:nuclear receptor binding set domain containing protein 1, nsd, putative [Anopheles sinensis]
MLAGANCGWCGVHFAGLNPQGERSGVKLETPTLNEEDTSRGAKWMLKGVLMAGHGTVQVALNKQQQTTDSGITTPNIKAFGDRPRPVNVRRLYPSHPGSFIIMSGTHSVWNPCPVHGVPVSQTLTFREVPWYQSKLYLGV